ncbi:MAG TPA: hypothetical protein VG963_25320 [Polyangiaceae bacterium]|nr:hypothetical protein [Polyangiaceae bacterium]
MESRDLQGRDRVGRDSRGGGTASSDATDFGRWLTRDLRHKGSNEPRSRERVRLPGSVVVPEPESDFARWLRTDLRPRNGSLPPTEFATAEAMVPAVYPVIATPGSAPAADSFGPHTIEELPIAEPPLEEELAPAALPSETLLQEEDLAVLPSRRRRGGARRWPALALLLVLLCFLGGVALWGGRDKPNMSTAPLPAPVAAAAEPAPAAPDTTEPPVSATPAAEKHRASKAAAEPQLSASMARGRGNGPSVGRFADLPLPTLSRLAKDEKQRIGERDAQARAAGKANRKSAAVLP